VENLAVKNIAKLTGKISGKEVKSLNHV